eukprot:10631078-Alexandrium_andersonii.AAC.1
MGPAQVRRLGLFGRYGTAQVPAGRPTCITSYSQSELDFFFMDEKLAAGLRAVTIDSRAGAKPHLPAQIESEADFSRILVPKIKKFKKLPRALPFGPVCEPQDWARSSRSAEDLAFRAKARAPGLGERGGGHAQGHGRPQGR